MFNFTRPVWGNLSDATSSKLAKFALFRVSYKYRLRYISKSLKGVHDKSTCDIASQKEQWIN